MSRKQTLKVFRTPIGFHDAYVAAPSQKAALEAWGSEHDLFSRGVAERVDDAELSREPLERPGVVIRRLRGTTAEQIAALPKDRPVRRQRAAQELADPPAPAEKAPSPRRAKAKPAPKPRPKPVKPRPDRSALDRAEAELAQVQARHKVEEEGFRQREAELARERRSAEKQYETEIRRLERAVEKSRQAYERSMRRWRG
ncbi:hypothetical protein [Flavisphingomonas formosensis]|uniref:hypothetical protein n=1 Tax=Flavisphingomonas formosensis TaxID=861534 RepID=UPI0012FC6EC2|nr:hypothetical protein [Sphingomonas formosensis]